MKLGILQHKWLTLCAATGLLVLSSTLWSGAESSVTEQSAASDDAPNLEQLSLGVQEVLRLAESGLSDDVILAYIETSQTFFNLEAEDIIYLNDVGIPADLVTAMMRRDRVLREEGLQPSTTGTNQFAYDQKLYGAGTNLPHAVQPVSGTNAPVYVTNAPTEVVYFYDSLAPYGTWIDLVGYGWCWQPRIVVIDRYWRPYWQGGRWIYSDFGWYWHSDYSWGWAPFHYGRWHHHHRHGWLWAPDLAWAPAWVSWRFSDVYCGWAPLPPGAHFVVGHGWYYNNVSVGLNFDFNLGHDVFTYVELRHLHERRPHLHGLHATQARDVHKHTAVINNYVPGPNTRLVNRGVPVEKVAAATGREIRPATVMDAAPAPQGVTRRDRLAKVGANTVIYRPEPRPPTRPRPLVAQKIDEQRAIVRPPPQRPSVAPPRRALSPTGRTGPPPTAPSAQPVQPRPRDSRVLRPAPTPAQPRPRDVRPSAPETGPVRPVQPPPQQTRPVQPAVPRQSVSPPQRHESPKGREQRLSNRSQIQRAPPTQPRPPTGRPAPQRGTHRQTPVQFSWIVRPNFLVFESTLPAVTDVSGRIGYPASRKAEAVQ